MATRCHGRICENIYDAKELFIKTTYWCIHCIMDKNNIVSCTNWYAGHCDYQNHLIYGDCFQFGYNDFTCPYNANTSTTSLNSNTLTYNLSSLTTVNSPLNFDYSPSWSSTSIGGIGGDVLALLLFLLFIFLVIACLLRKKRATKSKLNPAFQSYSINNDQPALKTDNNNIIDEPKSHDTSYTDFRVGERDLIYLKIDKNFDESAVYTSLGTNYDGNSVTRLKEKPDNNEYENIQKEISER